MLQFLRFLTDHLHMDIKKFPTRVPRKSGLLVGSWVLPPFRFTNSPLIPAANYYPCDLCEFARYNSLCAAQSSCAAHAYWSMQKLEQLESPTQSGTRAAIIRHLGLKVRRPKNGTTAKKEKLGGKARKQSKGKRVSDNRSNKKPVARGKKTARKLGERKRR